MTDKDKLVDLIARAEFDVISLDQEELAEEIIKAGFKRNEKDTKN